MKTHEGQPRRVLVVTFDFPPSLEIGAHACSHMARGLRDCGWDPIVLTVQQRFGVNVDPSTPYESPAAVVRTRVCPHPLEVWGVVRRLIRASGAGGDMATGTEPAGTLRRWILSLLRMPDVQTGWLPIAIVAGLRAVRRYRVQHVLSSGPHWTNHLVAACIATVARLPWTAHFRDPWMGIPLWKPVSRLSLAIESALEAMVMKRATAVVCVTERHRQMLLGRYPSLAAEKFVTVPNGFDDSEWAFLPSTTVAAEREKFVIAYVGSFYQARNPAPLFRAVRRLLDDKQIEEHSLCIKLVGWCDIAEGAEVARAVRHTRLETVVEFTGPLPRRQALAQMARADLLLLLAEDQPYQIPGKTYEYLRAGRPILAFTRPGAVADLLRDVPGVAVVDPANEAEISTVVEQRLRAWRLGEPAECPPASFVARFDRRRLAGELAAVLAGGQSEHTDEQVAVAMERR
jgi:glycosyltransferase involved in cell wall biosynthesis